MDEGVALHKLVFDNDGIAIDYIIEKINPGYERILKLKKENIEGKLSTEVYKTSTSPYLKEFSQVAFSGQSCCFESFFETYDMYFSISVCPWGKNGFATIFSDITCRKRAEEQIKSLLREKELLLKELHHRVTNNISAINNLLYLQSESVNNPEASAILKDASNRLKSLGLLHRKLYQSENLQECNTKEYFSQLIDEILAIFPNSHNVTTYKQIESFILSQKYLFPLGIIINELLSNSLKHAFSDTSKAVIKIQLTNNENNLCLIIEDNGKGISDEKLLKSNGFGISVVSLLAEQLKGDLKIDKDKGSKFVLKFRKDLGINFNLNQNGENEP